MASVATGIAAIAVAAVLGSAIYSRTMSGGSTGGQAAAGGGNAGGPGAGATVPPNASGSAGTRTGSSPGGPGATSNSGTSTGTGAAAPPPAGYRWQTVTAASVHATAGFVMAVPRRWHLRLQGQAAYFEAPGRAAYIKVSMSPFTYHQPGREAHYLQTTAIATHEYPGYVRVGIRAAAFQGTPAATWRFNWKPAGTPRTAVLSLLVTLPTSAGPQPYILTVSSPAASFPAARSAYGQALATFHVLPPS